jgi:hypothetical protein
MCELRKQVHDEGSLGPTFARSVRPKAISVRSMSKALSAERDYKVWHIEVDLDRYFKWFDLYAYPCFYCCNYFASAANVRTPILTDHINNQPFSITIKKESDDDDG